MGRGGNIRNKVVRGFTNKGQNRKFNYKEKIILVWENLRENLVDKITINGINRSGFELHLMKLIFIAHFNI